MDLPDIQYLVWCPQRGQTQAEARRYTAYDAEHAAAQWACWADEYILDYQIFRGTDVMVAVAKASEPSVVLDVLVHAQPDSAYAGFIESLAD